MAKVLELIDYVDTFKLVIPPAWVASRRAMVAVAALRSPAMRGEFVAVERLDCPRTNGCPSKPS
jgi:hypothetical protein